MKPFNNVPPFFESTIYIYTMHTFFFFLRLCFTRLRVSEVYLRFPFLLFSILLEPMHPRISKRLFIWTSVLSLNSSICSVSVRPSVPKCVCSSNHSSLSHPYPNSIEWKTTTTKKRVGNHWPSSDLFSLLTIHTSYRKLFNHFGWNVHHKMYSYFCASYATMSLSYQMHISINLCGIW